MTVTHLSAAECRARRQIALDRLRMTLDEARAQWKDCGCCLAGDNYDALADLETVSDMDYLLGENTK